MDSSTIPATQDPTGSCAAHRPPRQRDVLFGAGCGLLCFGLFPFSGSTVVTTPRDQLDGGDGVVADAFDASTRALSATFALTGLACVVLSCIDVPPRARLRAILLVILVPLVVATLTSGAAILQSAHAHDVVSVLRHSRVLSFDEELQVEPAVNDLYCVAQARKLCETGDDIAVRTLLGLNSHSQVEAACFRVDQKRRSSTNPSDLDPLALISEPTQAALHWCGQYVATRDHEGALDLMQSPYQQHRTEVIDTLLRARVRRDASAKLLMLLEWFAVPALGATTSWLHSLATVKPHVVAPIGVV